MKRAVDSRPFAKRSLGQNFLVDSSYIAKIVDALDVQPGDIIVEIGPGRGALTERLVDTCCKVIALELDREFVPFLADKFADANNFIVVEANVLETDFEQLIRKNTINEARSVRLVANLPYYISTAILQKLIEQRNLFSVMILMFQKEVVERITAPAGSSERGFLTVLVEAFFKVEKLFDVPPTAFRPSPKVWSSVVRIVPKPGQVENETSFRDLISTGFRQKRKTILNNFKVKYPNAAELIDAAGIDPILRPESLTLSDWTRLAGEVEKT